MTKKYTKPQATVLRVKFTACINTSPEIIGDPSVEDPEGDTEHEDGFASNMEDTPWSMDMWSE